ncbi:hypothetical protein ACP3T3_02915 [Chryseobacterium sp. CBSDS_008]|uniref:hypothetical protein n=1 Tax=Chryseobacterium sp. CBSDS_008 TaxID=3415265 RepID=UPI003CEFB049
MNKYPVKMDSVEKYLAESEVQKSKFIFNSMYLNPFIPITDLTYIMDEVRAFMQHWKHRKINQRNQPQFNRSSHETL